MSSLGEAEPVATNDDTKESDMRKLIGCAAVLVMLAIGSPVGAGADPVCVEIRLWYSGSSTPQYLVGPKKCVLPTPWDDSFDPHVDDRQSGVPTGLPNGAGITVWIPAP